MIINTRPEEVSKKIIELCEQKKIECKHVHMSRIEFLSGTKKQQIYKEVISSFESIHKDIRDLSQEFISMGADKLILT